MKRLLAVLAIGAMLGGCTGDTRVLVGDVGDHLTHDILDSVFGFLFPSEEGETGGEATSEAKEEEAPAE